MRVAQTSRHCIEGARGSVSSTGETPMRLVHIILPTYHPQDGSGTYAFRGGYQSLPCA